MVKKLVVCCLLVVSIFGTGLLKEEKVSAAYITVSPTKQIIENEDEYAEWHISWSGVPEYTVFFIPDTRLEFYTIALNAWFNSKYYQHRYDLGTRLIATYNPKFLVADYYAMAFTDVTVHMKEETNQKQSRKYIPQILVPIMEYCL